MRINNTISNQNNFLKLGKLVINEIKKNSEQQSNGIKKDNNTINGTPKNSVESLMANLLKQKENITNIKNKLIGNIVEKGGDISAIKDKLKDYDEQMEAIDKQLSELMMSEQKKQLEQTTEKKVKEEKVDPVEENLEKEGFQIVDKALNEGITSASANVKIGDSSMKVYTAKKHEFDVAFRSVDNDISGMDSALEGMNSAMNMVSHFNANSNNAIKNIDDVKEAKDIAKGKSEIGDETAAIYKYIENNTDINKEDQEPIEV